MSNFQTTLQVTRTLTVATLPANE